MNITLLADSYGASSRGGIVMKRFLYYIGWILLIGFLLYLGTKYYLFLKEEARTTFISDFFVMYNMVFTIIIGMLLKFPMLLQEIRLKKKWTFDWVKLLAFGIPTLYIVTIPFWANSSFGQQFLFSNYSRIVIGTPMITVAGVVLGYCLLDILKE